VTIDKDIHLSGGWDLAFIKQDGESIIDGQQTRRGLIVLEQRRVVIDRFVIQNGYAEGASGIYNYYGNLTLNDCIIRNNGGANARGEGGGVYSYGGIMTLNHCIVRGNSAAFGGGVVAVGESRVVISNSTIASNIASDNGGGLAIASSSTVELNNSTIGENQAVVREGGGVYVEQGILYLNSSTVSANSAYGVGGGGGIFSLNSAVTVQNTIIARNTATTGGSDCAGEVISLGFNLISDTTQCSFRANANDVLNTDAKLIPLVRELGLALLQDDSPAIDGGNPAGCTDHAGTTLLTDQRGAARSGRCDIGAYEYTPVAGLPAMLYAVDDATAQSAKVLDVFPLPLRSVALDSHYSQTTDPVEVLWTAPDCGPSGIFELTGTRWVATTTNRSGVAALQFVANELSGTYLVTATINGSPTPAVFNLRNLAWQPAGGFVEELSPLGDYEYVDNDRIQFAAPPDATNGNLLFASYSGYPQRDHLLRSSDGGVTWESIKLPKPASATQVAVAPHFTSTHTIYVLAGAELYKSTDAGAHWEAIALPLAARPALVRLSPDYLNDHTVFVGIYQPYTDRGGVYRTMDDGQTWVRLSTGDIGDAITDLDISPGYPKDPTMYLVDYNDGIFRSDNGGLLWTHLNAPQYSPDFRVALSPAFSHDHTLFVVASGISDSGVHRSVNRGDAWIRIKEGYFVNVLTVSPRYADDRTVIVAGDSGPLFITEDAGDTWLSLRGLRCDGIYGRRCDALITYQDDLLQPVASTYRTIYGYRWPTIAERVFVPLEPDVMTPVSRKLVIQPNNATGVSWTADVGADWLTVTPLTGTLPITLTLTVSPAAMTSDVMQTTINVVAHWSRYQTEIIRIPVVAMVVRSRAWLPLISRR
jgi:photosystem II stability/assembly factor-like uncharacterized protein